MEYSVSREGVVAEGNPVPDGEVTGVGEGLTIVNSGDGDGGAGESSGDGSEEEYGVPGSVDKVSTGEESSPGSVPSCVLFTVQLDTTVIIRMESDMAITILVCIRHFPTKDYSKLVLVL